MILLIKDRSVTKVYDSVHIDITRQIIRVTLRGGRGGCCCRCFSLCSRSLCGCLFPGSGLPAFCRIYGGCTALNRRSPVRKNRSLRDGFGVQNGRIRPGGFRGRCPGLYGNLCQFGHGGRFCHRLFPQPCPDARKNQHGKAGGGTGREQNPPEQAALRFRRCPPDDCRRFRCAVICFARRKKIRGLLFVFLRNQFHQPEELSVIHISSSSFRKVSSFFRVRARDIFTRLWPIP